MKAKTGLEKKLTPQGCKSNFHLYFERIPRNPLKNLDKFSWFFDLRIQHYSYPFASKISQTPYYSAQQYDANVIKVSASQIIKDLLVHFNRRTACSKCAGTYLLYPT